MEVTVRRGRLAGSAKVPSSKSILQRLMIAGMLSDGISEFHDVRHCNDTISCLAAIRKMVPQPADGLPLRISGCNGLLRSHPEIIHCGESGFALRALTSVAALSPHMHVLTGEGSLLRRPVGFMEKVLPALQVVCSTNQGFLPVSVKGPLKFRNISIDGSMTSQFLSGLLMVYPLADKDHVIEVSNLKSRSYVDLTLQVMKSSGISVSHQQYSRFIIPGRQKYRSRSIRVEGDWSAASFLLVAGATTGMIAIEGLSKDSLQPDRAIISVLQSSGVKVIEEGNIVSVKAPEDGLHSFHFDATHCPDLFPPLVALAICCKGTSVITGVERLVHKESNRAEALQQEFSKLNPELLRMEGNNMIVTGRLKLQSAIADAHNDHRIAMALAITGLNLENGITISGAESVQKSFPDFFTVLEGLCID